jgi:hypothetical protein
MHNNIQPIVSDIVYFHQFKVDYRMRSLSLERIFYYLSILSGKDFRGAL